MAKATKGRKKQRGKAPKWTSKNADKFALYEEAVYDPDSDLAFLQRIFEEKGKPAPKVLREDFAGTCKLGALWVASDEERTAHCLDLDPEPLAYGRKNHFPPLGNAVDRIEQLEEDVITATTPLADVITAFNFSYWIFKERATMLRYFSKVHSSLHEGGAFVLDIQGGPDVQSETEEEREQEDYWYHWRVQAMDAVTGDTRCSISFEFADGSELKDAFVYDWRLWHLTELRDILLEAGFGNVEVYWEGADEEGEGDGNFTLTHSEENEDCWISYLVAWVN